MLSNDDIAILSCMFALLANQLGIFFLPGNSVEEHDSDIKSTLSFDCHAI